MKLTDQEQVVLKAIGHGVAQISQVIKAVGYPKATVKKVLIGLSNKGAVSLHRHDWPSSLTPTQRKLMVKIGANYYGAVSVRERNPKGKHLRGATAQEQRQYEAILKEIRKSGRYKGREKEVAARTVRARAKNKSSKGKEALKTTGRALKKAASSVLGAGSQILGAGSKALNPRKKRRAKKHATRTVSAVSKARRTVAVRKAARKAKPSRSRKNVASKRKASATARHRSVVKARKSATRRLAGRAIKKSSGLLKRKRRNTQRIVNNAKIVNRHARILRRLKAIAKKIEQGQIYSISFPVLEKTAIEAGKHGMRWLHDRAEKEIQKRLRAGKRNPSAESIRKKFAGSVNGERDLFFPQGTPAGKLAKLGKLVSITTKAGTIKPVHGSAWLCADSKERLHIGSTTNAPLYSGPARNFGKVTKVEYESSKPHLGYVGPIIWFHRLGEENGKRPSLYADGKGGLRFKGGNYRLTERGIEN